MDARGHRASWWSGQRWPYCLLLCGDSRVLSSRSRWGWGYGICLRSVSKRTWVMSSNLTSHNIIQLEIGYLFTSCTYVLLRGPYLARRWFWNYLVWLYYFFFVIINLAEIVSLLGYILGLGCSLGWGAVLCWGTALALWFIMFLQ